MARRILSFKLKGIRKRFLVCPHKRRQLLIEEMGQ